MARRLAKAVLGQLLCWLARLSFTAHGRVVTPRSDQLALPRVSPPTGHVAKLSYVLGSTISKRDPKAEAAS